MKKLKVFYDSLFLQHETGAHPEKPERLRSISELFDEIVDNRLEVAKPTFAAEEDILRVHDRSVLETARECSSESRPIDQDTVTSEHSFAAAMLAAGAAINTVDSVHHGESKFAFCAARPPGHHATPTKSMGFCLFNNIAVAAAHLVENHGYDRVAIIDWDVHHGNGTQDIFYSSGKVFFASIHQGAFYPGTGQASEVGEGEGEGKTLNVPLNAGAPMSYYRENFQFLVDRVQEFCPQFVLISAGFDGHKDDPIGGLLIETEDFAWMTERVCEMADMEGAKVASFLEGGYNLTALKDSVAAHWLALLEH